MSVTILQRLEYTYDLESLFFPVVSEKHQICGSLTIPVTAAAVCHELGQLFQNKILFCNQPEDEINN